MYVSFLMSVIYVFQGRPGYMMPFMGLQVFIFCLSSLTVVSYLSDVPYIKRVLADLVSNDDPEWWYLIIMFSLLLNALICVCRNTISPDLWSIYTVKLLARFFFLHFAQFWNNYRGIEYVQGVDVICCNCKIAELVTSSLLLLHLPLYKYWSFLWK